MDTAGESFTVHDLEQNEIENVAAGAPRENITTCACKGICLRERGRNACPCRNLKQYCTSSCHQAGPEVHKCMNRARVLHDDTDSSSTESIVSVAIF